MSEKVTSYRNLSKYILQIYVSYSSQWLSEQNGLKQVRLLLLFIRKESA